MGKKKKQLKKKKKKKPNKTFGKTKQNLMV